MPVHDRHTTHASALPHPGEQTLKNSQQTPWYRQIAAVIFQHGVLKGIGTPLFIGLFFGAYFYVLKTPAYPTTVMPLTWLDQMISFQPRAMRCMSHCGVCFPAAALLATRRELYRYGMAMAELPSGLIAFYFWPPRSPQPILTGPVS